jgi:hypothetical protein
MAERTKRQNEIVDKMIADALVTAAEFERECAALSERQTIDEMADVVGELSQWIEERDAGKLERFSISMERGANGHLLFRLIGKRDPFIVRPRAEMTISAGGEIVQLNPDLPILDEEVYAEVLERIFIWAGVSGAGMRKKF